jgi:hypothetical protein
MLHVWGDEKPEWKEYLGDLWEANIKTDLKRNIMWKFRLDSTGPGKVQWQTLVIRKDIGIYQHVHTALLPR